MKSNFRGMNVRAPVPPNNIGGGDADPCADGATTSACLADHLAEKWVGRRNDFGRSMPPAMEQVSHHSLVVPALAQPVDGG